MSLVRRLPLQVLARFRAPFRPSLMDSQAFISAAELLLFALEKQGSVAKAGPNHRAALPHYTADQLRRVVGDAHKFSHLLCRLEKKPALQQAWTVTLPAGQRSCKFVKHISAPATLQGLLRRRTTDFSYLAAPRLLRALAAALDTASGSSLCTQHAILLAGVPTNCFIAQPLEASDLRAHWGRRFQREATWHAVRAQLLPALAALCAQLTHGSEERNALFWEVALSAVGAIKYRVGGQVTTVSRLRGAGAVSEQPAGLAAGHARLARCAQLLNGVSDCSLSEKDLSPSSKAPQD